ncbi:hypothetical protein, partial [Candidatus Erwinia dacicola]|uniref:hypothetical protein n=1 Tax=Candidatus Erwinia dacicola TaxID=252393 RepID=UPI001C9CBAF9
FSTMTRITVHFARIGVHLTGIAVHVSRIILNALIFAAIPLPLIPRRDVCQTRELSTAVEL